MASFLAGLELREFIKVITSLCSSPKAPCAPPPSISVAKSQDLLYKDRNPEQDSNRHTAQLLRPEHPGVEQDHRHESGRSVDDPAKVHK